MKEFMTAQELYKNDDSIESKKISIINYTIYLHNLYKRPLQKSDFSITGRISHNTINKLFGGITNLLKDCNIASVKKSPNISFKNFLTEIKDITDSGCWIESYYKDESAYPYKKIKYKNKKIFLHRVSYLEFKGNIPDKLVIKHLCNNPRCFNPEHLEADTHSNNIKEAYRDGLMNNKEHITIGTIKDPYDYNNLLLFIKNNIIITDKNEWLYQGSLSPSGYAIRTINKKNYYLHKLLAANKYNILYEETDIVRHVLPDNSRPLKNDINPDHLILGSNYDNWKDSLSYKSDIKLSFEIADNIRKEAELIDFSILGSKKQFDLKWAKLLKVSESTISKIRLNKSWINKEETSHT